MHFIRREASATLKLKTLYRYFIRLTKTDKTSRTNLIYQTNLIRFRRRAIVEFNCLLDLELNSSELNLTVVQRATSGFLCLRIDIGKLTALKLIKYYDGIPSICLLYLNPFICYVQVKFKQEIMQQKIHCKPTFYHWLFFFHAFFYLINLRKSLKVNILFLSSIFSFPFLSCTCLVNFPNYPLLRLYSIFNRPRDLMDVLNNLSY